MNRDNLTAVVTKFAIAINPSLKGQEVYDELLTHPDYPNLLASSDVLTFLGIDNNAYKVSNSELDKIPCPFIAHTRENNGEFLLVHKVGSEQITVSNQLWSRNKIKRNEFEKSFDGVVLVAENIQEKSGAFKNTALAGLRLPLLSFMLLMAFFYYLAIHTNIISNLTWPVLPLAIFKTIGLVVSILLLIQSIDSNNNIVQRFCGGEKKNDCNDILSSKAAKIYGGLSWSEIGFFYFSSGWLFMALTGASLVGVQLLLLATIMCLPFTFYSIYYQARIAKKWCLLCCTIQAVLWLEFFSEIPLFKLNILNLSRVELSVVTISIILPVAIWLLMKPVFRAAQQVHPLKLQLQKFKYDNDLFKARLMSQPKYQQPDQEWSIVLGNEQGSNIITMVTNPYCTPCANTHKVLHELLNRQPDLQVRIVLTADNTDQDIKTPVSRHLMTLQALPDKSIVANALHDWYGQKQKSYEEWAKNYPAQPKEIEYDKINKQKAWCELAGVTVTPTMLLNGYKLPELYQLSDLKYMLQ